MTPRVGQTVSHYRIVEHLGGGGMGIVYKARDLKLERCVALKFLPRELTRDPDAKQRFVHEARAASGLQHNNICVIHDIDETADAQLFIVMEFYEGETIKKKIARGPLSLPLALDLSIQVGNGLAEAHRCGIIHRDIKPANVMVTRQGIPKIVDFGVAKLVGATKLTKSGSTVGTAMYMSPEQTRSESVDQRTDIWSLGVVLYEMLAGRKPFESSYEQAVVYAILNTDPPLVSSLRPGISPDLDRIVGTALRKDPAQRYQHAEEMVTDLEQLARRRSTATPHGTPPPSVEEIPCQPRPTDAAHSRRRRRLAGISAGVVVLGGTLAWFLLSPTTPTPDTGPKKLKLAILPVRNMTQKPEVEEWANRIRESLLLEELAVHDEIAVLSPSFIAQAAKAPGVNATPQQRRELYAHAAEAGADFALEGAVLPAGKAYALQMNLVEPRNGNVRYAAKTEFTGQKKLKEAASVVARQTLFFLDIEVLHPNRDLRPWIPAHLRDVRAKEAFVAAATIIYTGEAGGGEYLNRAIGYDSSFIAPRVWLTPGLVYAGRTAEARRHYRVLRSLEGSASPFERTMIELVKAQITHDLRGQTHALEKALLYAPWNRIVLINLGWVKYQLCDYEGALRDLDTVVSSRMPYPPLSPLYARTLLKLGRFDEARRILVQALEMRPVDADTYGMMAAFSWKDGDSVSAARYEMLFAERVKDFGREWSDIYESLGGYLLDMQAYDRAALFLQRAISGNPKAPLPHAYLARALCASGDTAQAIREAEKAVSLDPRLPEAHLFLGTVCDARGEVDQAVQHYRRYLMCDSASVKARTTERRLVVLTAARQTSRARNNQ